MKLISLVFATVLFSSQTFAYSSGTMTCFFELFSTKAWPKVEKTPEFSFNIMEMYESSIESKNLNNKIRLRYVPGLVARNDVRVISIVMTYDSADSGAEVPFVPEGEYSFNIGRQGSDLVGAFMQCKVKDLK